MLIVCPTCASEYRIETGRLGPEGRSVRCAACRETWFISAAEIVSAQAAELDRAEAATPEADADWAEAAAAVRSAVGEGAPAETGAAAGGAKKPAAVRPRKTAGAGRRKRRGALTPAVAAALAILAVLPLACLARGAVVRAMPQSAGLYARLGLPVNLRGLEIRDVVAFRNPAQAGRPAELVVEGDLVGLQREGAPVPDLAVEVRDAAAHPLKVLPIPAPRRSLAAGETARFRAAFPDPPVGGRSLDVRFGPAQAPAS